MLMSDIYHSPEDFGLKTVAEFRVEDMSWEFNLLVVWQREYDGMLVYGEDQGCSCPSPFETHGVQNLTPASRMDIVNRVHQRIEEHYYMGDEDRNAAQARAVEFIRQLPPGTPEPPRREGLGPLGREAIERAT